MPRLKVLFLPASYPSEINPIAGIFVKEQARAASLYNDIRVLYACPDSSPRPTRFYRISADIEDGIPTVRVSYGNHLMIWRKLLPYFGIFAAFRRLLKEGWKPDIIHAHFFTAGALAAILGKMYGIPVIITEHTTSVATHSLGAFERRRLRFAMKRAQAILPVSHDLSGAIEDYYGIHNRIQVVPNVVNTEVFYPAASPARQEPKAKKTMLLVGALTPRKGIPDLLEALNQIRSKRQDFVLNIVGDGANRREYEQLAKNLGLNNMVKFHGRQPEIAKFVRECDFFVLPSLYENFGVVYIEAMACGKPVIATSAGGPREIVNDDVGILVPPKDVKALKEAIEYMLDNYQSYSPEKIAQYAKEKFGYETVGQMLDQVYRSLSPGKAFNRNNYEPEIYWQERLNRDFSLVGVGCFGIGIGYNHWLYKARTRALTRLLKKNKIDAQGKRVLDIGVGNGFYINYWKRKRAQSITGIDITEKSISTLATKYPEYQFLKADISAAELPLKETFDIITAFDVLFHIVDEDKFEQAIRNIRRLSHHQTKVLIMDSFLKNMLPAGFHQNYRTLERYQGVLREEGIEMVELIPIFYFMSAPIDRAAVKSKFLLRLLPCVQGSILKALSLSKRLSLFRRSTDFLIGHSLGFLFYFIDGIVLRYSQDGPSEKLLFAKIKE